MVSFDKEKSDHSNFLLAAEEEVVIAWVTILMRAFCNTCSDLQMEKTAHCYIDVP